MASMFSKGAIFATFFLSLICGSLVCTSLVTNHWIESKPWRKRNPTGSSGRIFFGLLHGRKELNVAFGLRPHNITVSEMIEKNPKLMSWHLWCTTLISTCMALVFSSIAAFLAVVNSFTTPRIEMFSVLGIYLANIMALLMCFLSTCTWSIQFHTKLSENVLPNEDLDNFWTSKEASMLGFSFWLVFVAGIVHLINILLIKWSTVRKRRKRQKPVNATEEKSVSAIMLY